jgi:hypothetical protein
MMKKQIGLYLATLMLCGGALSAQPVRPPITSVSHLSVYTSDAARAVGKPCCSPFTASDPEAVK